jgi:hypothetical protein
MSGTATRRDPGKYDMWIEHGGIKLPYNIARGEGKAIQWFEGTAPMNQPEQNQQGFGYHATPSYMNDPIEYSQWGGGAGQFYAPPGAKSTNRYSYTQHIDLSYGDRGYKSPARVAGTDLTAEIKKVVFSPLGVFAIVADEVWEYNTSTDVWDSVLTGVTPTDIVSYGTYIIVFNGSNSYSYSTTGASASWTTSTATGHEYSFGVVRSGSAGTPVLWAISASGGISNATNITNAGEDWATNSQIGDTWEVVNGLELINDEFVILKDTGLYLYDGITKFDLYPAATAALASNGSHHTTWINNKMYLNLGDKLQEYDAARRSFRQVWPAEDDVAHPELNGTITAMGRTNEHLYFALLNAAGNTYIMRGDPDRGGFHTWVYHGSTSCTALSGQRAGAIHAANPVMVAAYGTFASNYVLPGPNLRPENDANCNFETAAGIAVWPWMDGGAALHTKFITGGKLTGETMINDPDAGFVRTLVWSYALDGSALVTDLVQGETAGITVGVPPDAVKYTWIQGRLTMNTDDTTITPVFKGAVFNSTPNPPGRRLWTGLLDLKGIDIGPRGGSPGKQDEYILRQHLFNSQSSRVLLYDRWGVRWVAKMHNVQQGNLVENPGMDDDKVQVTLFEMGESGYLSTWYGTGSKFLLPDLPGGASGIYTDTTPPATESGIFRPQTIVDHVRWEIGSQTHSAILFKGVTVPQGATIVSAKVRMRLFAVVAGTVDIDQYMEDADTGVVPASGAAAEALTLTTATSRWTQEVTGADAWYTWFDHEDITAVIQEIVDRAGWTSGADMLYVARQRAVTGSVYARWFDTTILSAITHENFPELVLEWTV